MKDYNHWDFMFDIYGPGPLKANVCFNLAFWETQPGGIYGLEQVLKFVEHLKRLAELHPTRFDGSFHARLFENFVDMNDINDHEGSLIKEVLKARTPEDFRWIEMEIESFVNQQKATPYIPVLEEKAKAKRKKKSLWTQFKEAFL